MKLAPIILAIISRWAPPSPAPGLPPETHDAYEARLETIAEATSTIAEESSWHWGGNLAAAGVLTVWYAETRFDPYIHAGIPNPDRAFHEDHGRARCLGSVHRNAHLSEEEWLDLAGTSLDATLRCARITTQALGVSLFQCARDMKPSEEALALALEHYARGHCAEPTEESRRRARQWRRIWAKL